MKKLLFLFLLLIVNLPFAKAQIKVGDFVTEIKLPDSLGKWKPLSEVKAKIILIDFWAAWCYPCMKSMPELVALYEKYKDKGLEIYAISLDKNYYNWVDACRRKNLPFILVNDAYGLAGKACKDYQVASIPTKVLIKGDKVIGAEMSLYNLEQLIKKELDY